MRVGLGNNADNERTRRTEESGPKGDSSINARRDSGINSPSSAPDNRSDSFESTATFEDLGDRPAGRRALPGNSDPTDTPASTAAADTADTDTPPGTTRDAGRRSPFTVNRDIASDGPIGRRAAGSPNAVNAPGNAAQGDLPMVEVDLRELDTPEEVTAKLNELEPIITDLQNSPNNSTRSWARRVSLPNFDALRDIHMPENFVLPDEEFLDKLAAQGNQLNAVSAYNLLNLYVRTSNTYENKPGAKDAGEQSLDRAAYDNIIDQDANIRGQVATSESSTDFEPAETKEEVVARVDAERAEAARIAGENRAREEEQISNPQTPEDYAKAFREIGRQASESGGQLPAGMGSLIQTIATILGGRKEQALSTDEKAFLDRLRGMLQQKLQNPQATDSQLFELIKRYVLENGFQTASSGSLLPAAA